MVHFSQLFDNNFDLTRESQYKVLLRTLKETYTDTNTKVQVWEAECVDGMILYMRFSKGNIICKEKWNGALICMGSPVLHHESIPIDKVPFYIEMYSKHKIQFQ